MLEIPETVGYLIESLLPLSSLKKTQHTASVHVPKTDEIGTCTKIRVASANVAGLRVTSADAAVHVPKTDEIGTCT